MHQRGDPGATPVTSQPDADWFRTVLGRHPTGVAVVTGNSQRHGPAGMVVGSFTSVSLNPPLVGFFPEKSSTSWPKIQSADRFCVNILSSDQEDVCRRFATRGIDKFAGQRYTLSDLGSPVIEDAVAWIECDLQRIEDAGDHLLVIGRVLDLKLGTPGLPLLFFMGRYGRFSPLSPTGADIGGAAQE